MDAVWNRILSWFGLFCHILQFDFVLLKDFSIWYKALYKRVREKWILFIVFVKVIRIFYFYLLQTSDLTWDSSLPRDLARVNNLVVNNTTASTPAAALPCAIAFAYNNFTRGPNKRFTVCSICSHKIKVAGSTALNFPRHVKTHKSLCNVEVNVSTLWTVSKHV